MWVMVNLLETFFCICESKILKDTGFQGPKNHIPPSKIYRQLDLK